MNKPIYKENNPEKQKVKTWKSFNAMYIGMAEMTQEHNTKNYNIFKMYETKR